MDYPSAFTSSLQRSLATALVAGTLLLAYTLREVLFSLFFSFFLAYALHPFASRLERIGFSRPLASIITMLGIALLFISTLMYSIPLLIDELYDSAIEFPQQLVKAQMKIEPWLWKFFKMKTPHSINELNRAWISKIQTPLPTLFNALGIILFGTLSYVRIACSLLLIFLFSIYFLIDFNRLITCAALLVPRPWSSTVTSTAMEIHDSLGEYLRGQLRANVVLAALYSLGLWILDVRLAIPIGMITGFLAFIPYFGFGLGVSLTLTVTLLDWQGPEHIVGAILTMLLIQVADALVITPRIVASSIGLTPVEVLLTTVVMASLFGFTGVLFAVPFGAISKILLKRGLDVYWRSSLYQGPKYSSTLPPL
ncbi:AI-2E family transporter [Pajaroellobacter abortibovis]|uniref:AI-2E family transporter n=1 Tax=Pajaroellobacter abortibovis TaxID=1882918 RepID=A0A1L6MXU7_9BACT|nr:AI-2E family transporter [Pajaroellobacter abortibovis]APS00296.1 hypothetical protein BCY86_06075 [Pajaroellobacter abortibovis]